MGKMWESALYAGVLVGVGMGFCAATVAQPLSLNTERQWYAQGFAGLNFAHGVAVGDSIPPDFTYDLTFDPGYAIGGAVGVAFDSGLRVELEASYRANGPDEVCFFGACGDPAAVIDPSVDGDLSAVALMINALYDFDTGTPFTPYVGAGIGAGNVDYSVDFAGAGYSADAWGLALQFIAGLSYQMTPQFALFADYRFLTILDSEVSAVYPPGGYTISVEDDYAAHNFIVGLRYMFQGASAAAEDPSADMIEPGTAPSGEPVSVASLSEPEAALQRYVVVFDGTETEIGSPSRAVIISALEEYESSGFVRIFAQGTTDVFGGGADIAMSRAHAIRRDLLNRGIGAERIVVRAFGSEHPLIPTPGGAPAVSEPRVEVIML